MVDQSNPYGSLTYARDPYAPGGYAASMQYSPGEQALFNQGQWGAGSMGSTTPAFSGDALATLGIAPSQYGYGLQSSAQGQGLIGTGASIINSGNYDPGQINQQTNALTGQLMGGEMSAMAPFFQQQTNQLDTQLMNEGIMPSATAPAGTQNAWNNANLQNQYGQGLIAENALAQLQPQAYNEALQGYQLPATLGSSIIGAGAGLGQLGQGYMGTGYGANASAGGLLGSGAQGLQGLESMIPQLNQTTTQTPGLSVQPANLVGATSAYDQSATGLYQAQLQQQGALYNALGGLGGGLLGGLAKNPTVLAALGL
jgi:hypothetical protein